MDALPRGGQPQCTFPLGTASVLLCFLVPFQNLQHYAEFGRACFLASCEAPISLLIKTECLHQESQEQILGTLGGGALVCLDT